MFKRLRRSWKAGLVIAVLALLIADRISDEKAISAPNPFSDTELNDLVIAQVFPEAELICFIPEYRSVREYLQENGIASQLRGYVGENDLGLVQVKPTGQELSYASRGDGYIYNLNGCMNPNDYKFRVRRESYPDNSRTAKYLEILTNR